MEPKKAGIIAAIITAGVGAALIYCAWLLKGFFDAFK